ncbi:MinD-like ATPase involved in chromosome partitioning or flagellar assembly [Paraoerskovia marina]|uniref:MinD-like ATPase involved in chromosome partitioning or flagellar assembly n=1 Tax=Paraoerskovia marina TaxID=545619 RepID=A0A1H1QZZ2_9CELL|nr:hypothetical protein [Paraoerskovia marina]SDS28936.1 MinD-like ATPase involved in chromosome partitioning or flagellar assembly [Paraoerskovia marina]
MTAPITVLCMLRGRAESAVVEAIAEPSSGAAVTRRCADRAELMAAAVAGAGEVALVPAGPGGLDRESVAALHDVGVRVVAAAESGAAADAARATGVDVVCDASPAASVVDAIRRASLNEAPGRTEPGPRAQVPARRGAVIAVWGPTGAPGRTTVAVNLAAELAEPPSRRRRRGVVTVSSSSMVVDADTYGGSVAQHLGLLEESPGLVKAARLAGRGALDRTALGEIVLQVRPRMHVLTGIARPQRWPELPGPSLDAVWDVARGLVDNVVIDCGFGIEHDEELTYDTRAPQRNAATISALRAADVVVVTGSGEPVGVQRLVRALDDLTESGFGMTAARVVVANRVRSSVSGQGAEAAVQGLLARFAGADDVLVLPEDRPALDRAMLEGRVLLEAAPNAPARKAMSTLAARVRSLAIARSGTGVHAAAATAGADAPDWTDVAAAPMLAD